MLVTELGIVTLVRLLQSSKALFPMLVTELGIVTLVRLLQFLKALFPMLVTELGIVTSPPLPLYFVSTPFSMVKSLSAAYAFMSHGAKNASSVRISSAGINRLFFIF